MSNDISRLTPFMINFLLILLRSSIFVSLLPVIGGKELPAQFRLGLAVVIALMLTPTVKIVVSENAIPLLVLKEILMGFALGFTARFVFMAINLAGHLISQSMGLSVASIFNPEMGEQTQISEIMGIMAMIYFFAMDAHHEIIYIFIRSYDLLPAGQFNIMPVIPEVLAMGNKMFVLALKLAAPVLVGLLVVQLLSGFLYKVAPQMNIYFISMPLNLVLGFMILILSVPVFEKVFNMNFGDLHREMERILTLAKG